MNSKDKLELALHEAYIKAYKLAEPSADFDTLVENAEIMSDGKKNIHFENYFLDEDIEENILNEVAKKYKLSGPPPISPTYMDSLQTARQPSC